MGIQYKTKRSSITKNITNWIFENFFGQITAPKLKTILNENIILIDEVHGKNQAKYADYYNGTNQTLSNLVPGYTLGDYDLAAGDIVLLGGQSSAGENGLWEIQTTGSPTRPITFDDDTKQNRSLVLINLLSTGVTDGIYLVQKLAGSISVSAFSADVRTQVIADQALIAGNTPINHNMQTKYFTVTFQDSVTGSEANQYPVKSKTASSFIVSSPIPVERVDIILKK